MWHDLLRSIMLSHIYTQPENAARSLSRSFGNHVNEDCDEQFPASVPGDRSRCL